MPGLSRSPDPAERIARLAVRALYAEVVLEPKPGLVSLRDNGSHTDMNAQTFIRSLFALRHYFRHVARAGMAEQPFDALQALGIAAEQRMLRATGGINTHRGAVFSLGLLCAAAGWLTARQTPITPESVRSALVSQWGPALRQRALAARHGAPVSHGQRAARRFHLRSAHDEAADGFPTLFDVTLPALEDALARGHSGREAKVHALFATMARLDDTNVAHRGGLEGIAWVKARAAAFLADGSVAQSGWLPVARALHAQCVARCLSPGGAADLMACAIWTQAMQATTAMHRDAAVPQPKRVPV